MEKFEIKLKSNNNIFTAGDTVYGFIYLFLKDSIKAKSIKLLIFGKIDTKWAYSDGKSYIRYRGEDSYVKLEFIIWNGAEHGDTLNPGEHQFPFNFTIPQYCPFSFEGKYGQIHYYFKAEVDRPWRLNSKAELTFVVKPQVDLNQIPDIGRPVLGCIDDDLGVKFFSNGKVDAKITLLKSGYICGEAITPNISITNSSTKSIQKIEISLEQFILCRAKAFGKVSIENGEGEVSGCHRTKTTRNQVIEQKADLKIPPNSTGSYSASLIVPETITTFNSSPIMKIEYFLKIKIITEGLIGNSVSLKMPIVIGTIPIEDITYSDPPPPYEIKLTIDD